MGSVLFCYLAVTAHNQMTMGKSAYFIGQLEQEDTRMDEAAASSFFDATAHGIPSL